MNQCSIVIGAGYGDECKGHMTDILCSKSKSTLNVRFNGGAQASHTVVTPEGKRHAFRHFGAGSFSGADTYLSEMFIVNPMAFVLERKELTKHFELTPNVLVNPKCFVTTLWDMYINQCIETMRGDERHGSCGFGINETVERSSESPFKITVKDLANPIILRSKLEKIQNEYVEIRLKKEYGLTMQELPKQYQELLTDPENINMSLFYAYEFLMAVKIVGDEIIDQYENVVFEGAQGLLLDQNNAEYFPHVTSSNTGIKNVMEILENKKYSGKASIYYMSRCYMTRHGVGPFKSEVEGKVYPNIEDLTNIPNEFQGTLRFGILDLDLLAKEIKKDLFNLKVQASINIVFTCLDQMADVAKFIENDMLKEVKSSEFLEIVKKILRTKIPELSNIYATYGLTRYEFK